MRAGGRVRFDLRLHNGEAHPQQVVLAVEEPGDGWTAMVPTRTLTLQADSTVVVTIRLDAPPDAPLGSRMTFQMSAAGSARPHRPAVLIAEVIVEV